IRATRARISAWTGGRPTVGRPESLAECSRKRRRCQRSTVSGATITRAFLHPVHTLDNQAQKSRSLRRRFGRVTLRLYTASCWRRATCSRASWRGPPQRNGESRSRWSRVLIMDRNCLLIRAERAIRSTGRGFGEGQVEELELASLRRGATLGNPVTLWV